LNKKYLVNLGEVVPYRTLALGEFLGSPLDFFQVLIAITPLNKFTELQYLKWKWPKLISMVRPTQLVRVLQTFLFLNKHCVEKAIYEVNFRNIETHEEIPGPCCGITLL